jgi:hypothetical protein
MDAPNKATYPREQTRIPSSLEVGSTKLRDASTRREASTLRNETERLDEARRAGGARALYLVRRFHDEFPDSSLAADAEIVALRALLRLGEQQLFRERALSFLARFPGDPHEGHVTRWLEE